MHFLSTIQKVMVTEEDIKVMSKIIIGSSRII